MLKTYPSWTHFSYGHCRASVVHTMINFTLITAFILCSLNWICVSVSETQTVEVQPGQEAKLLISNISKEVNLTFWFRLINRTRVSCISVMRNYEDQAEFCEGYGNGNFEMRYAGSSVFLKIKQVDLSDSGLYFCGFYNSGRPIFRVIDLKVKGSNESHDDMDNKCKEECDGTAKLMSVILRSLTVFPTIIIIILVVKIRKLQKALNEEPKTERHKDLGSDDLNYAALSFQAKAKRNRRPASERELEPNVVYAATR
ncbi:uncharacterized protein LOC121177247 isoform X1 [Toxotes jaculatrix]|uniref:uncharacterized protein LOC121177247 isoform X1 n=1 Tax=Toxotes jaculatrix TaxID=941984 RepID=UPI001B3A8870|nr:uncharacterized protein LOC121177247 isoform X1 [Toxotes jaculatrix]